LKKSSLSLFCRRCIFAILFLAIVYFSWRPSPAIAQISWLPSALGVWLDQHDFSKNVIGYGLFALSGFFAWPSTRQAELPVRSTSKPRINHLSLLIAFCLLVVLLELGQLALPRRVCDWVDVLAGCTGILLAWSVSQLARFFLAARNG
jgi:hypothetical protein